MKRVGTLKANILGAAMIGLAAFSAGPAIADTGMTPSRDNGSVATATASATGTDYGRGTTRSDNSPGNAGGLS